jgi:hypothetical protein
MQESEDAYLYVPLGVGKDNGSLRYPSQ